MHDLLTSDEFNHYQTKLLEDVNACLLGMLNSGRYEEFKGALTLARQVARFPVKLSDTQELRDAINDNLNRFQSNFLRKEAEKQNR